MIAKARKASAAGVRRNDHMTETISPAYAGLAVAELI